MKLKLTHRTRLIFTMIAVGLLFGIAFFFTAKSGFLAFSGPTIIRVSTTGNDSNDGSSWTLAKKTIGAAITTAGTSSAEIWIQKGIYQESGLVVSNNTAGLGFYGGFDGTEVAKESRPIYQENSTVIDSQNNGRTLRIWSTDNIAIDRLTLRNGASAYGGCLSYSSSRYLSLIDVVAEDCHVTTGGGGGMYLRGGSSQTSINFNNLTVRRSSAPNLTGGGIWVESAEFTGSRLLIENCTALQGGGMYANSLTSSNFPQPGISNVIIRNNTASSTNQYEGGGGMLIEGVQRVMLSKFFLSNNKANAGAAILSIAGSTYALSDSIISNNTSQVGAMVFSGSGTSPMLLFDTFSDNIGTVRVSTIFFTNLGGAQFNSDLFTYNTGATGTMGHDTSGSSWPMGNCGSWANTPRNFENIDEENHNGGWTPYNPNYLNRTFLDNPLSYETTLVTGNWIDYAFANDTLFDFSGATRPINAKGLSVSLADVGAFEYQGVQQHFALTGFSGDLSSKLVSFVAKDSGGNVIGSGDLPEAADGFFVLPAKTDSTAFKKDTGPYTFSFSADGYQTTNLTVTTMPADNSIGQTVTLDPVSSTQKEYLRLYNWVGPNGDQSFPSDFKITLTIKDMIGITQYTGDIPLGATDLVPSSSTYQMSPYTIPNRNQGSKLGQPFVAGETMRVCFGFLSYLTSCQNVTATSTNFFNTNFNLTGGDTNNDTHIGLTDLGLVLGDFGKTRTNSDNPASDINWSLNVDLLDLGIVLGGSDATGDTP